ncbi:MAG: TetR/AcrR family transcriptional regulator [Mangrovicoccus sp.]
MSKKQAYHHGDLRQHLISATRELVERKGAHAFSVSEAARTAGVSSAAPYRHFKDRAAMLDAVAVDGHQRMAERFLDAVKDLSVGSIEAITAIGLAYIHFAEQESGVFRVMFAADDATPEDVSNASQCCYDIVQQHVAVYLGHGEPGPETRAATFPIWTFVHGIAFLTIDGKLSSKDDEIRDIPAIVRMGAERLLGPAATG